MDSVEIVKEKIDLEEQHIVSDSSSETYHTDPHCHNVKHMEKPKGIRKEVAEAWYDGCKQCTTDEGYRTDKGRIPNDEIADNVC